MSNYEIADTVNVGGIEVTVFRDRATENCNAHIDMGDMWVAVEKIHIHSYGTNRNTIDLVNDGFIGCINRVSLSNVAKIERVLAENGIEVEFHDHE